MVKWGSLKPCKFLVKSKNSVTGSFDYHVPSIYLSSVVPSANAINVREPVFCKKLAHFINKLQILFISFLRKNGFANV